jgi:hypothetical protein
MERQGCSTRWGRATTDGSGLRAADRRDAVQCATPSGNFLKNNFYMGLSYLNFKLKGIQKKLTKVVTVTLRNYIVITFAGHYCCFN